MTDEAAEKMDALGRLMVILPRFSEAFLDALERHLVKQFNDQPHALRFVGDVVTA